MKKLYIQPNMQLQPMNISGLVCASGGVISSITNAAGLELAPSPVDDIDPM